MRTTAVRCSAALALLCLAGYAQEGGEDAQLQARVDAALAKARPVLREHLQLQHGGVLALLCLAAVHDGVPADDRVFARALERLSRARLTGTYDLALRLIVMAEVQDVPRREQLAAADTKALLHRRLHGGFSYARRYETWDLSNTQYAVLGLRAAVALGQAVKPAVWNDVARAVVAAQAEDGGFAYTSRHRRHRPYASMTVAGIAVLEVCRQQLGAATPEHLGAAIERAWAWMARNSHAIGNRDTLCCLYFHYGLERAAILSDVSLVGEVDWYRAGAEMLLREQLDSGAWQSLVEIRPGALPGEGSPIDTAFAILFLRRKFTKQLPVPLTGPRGLDWLSDNADAGQVERAASAMVARGHTAIPELLIALRSPVMARRRAAIRALTELAGADFGSRADQHPEDSAAQIKAAELWWLTEGRKR
jgi:hypothetical protein